MRLTLWLARALAGAALFLPSCSQTSPRMEAACTGTEQPTTRLFLQQVSGTGAIVKWRGPAMAVCLGTDPGALAMRVSATEEEEHKLARVTGLEADTVYYYSVGASSRADPNRRFRTAPTTGASPSDGNIHIWMLGDSGTAAERDDDGELEHPGEAEAVKQGFLSYNRDHGGEPLDLILLLGDNAYTAGTDAEWQAAFFELYPDLLEATPLVPTIGNHEMGFGVMDACLFIDMPGCEKGPVHFPQGGASMSADPSSYDGDGDGKPEPGGLPYLGIFSLPARAELGGIPSGTEQYYSIDYGNLHIVSLDSQLSTADPEQLRAMRDWLVGDLSANAQDWTIVIFHHPPYSKGQNHDSDVEQREIDMRESFAEVFEAHGVDAIYSGHSHSYERSWYLHGHYGSSETFDPKVHAEVDIHGRPTWGQSADPYPQISAASGVDDKVVYTVAGSSGKTSGPYGRPACRDGQHAGCTMADWLQHPAHRSFEKLAPDYQPHGIARLGSVVLDVTADTLTSRFVDHEGRVLDYFIITKDAP